MQGPTDPETRRTLARTWQWFRWRSLLLVVVFACGLASFRMGVSTTQRPNVGGAGVLEQAYYTLGLFVLGGMDLGVPAKGPPEGLLLLWLAYFAAPAITASAVIEGVLRAIRPRTWGLRRLRNHVVIAGCGRITMLYLERLRAVHPRKQVVIIEPRVDRPNVEQAQDVYGAIVVAGDISDDLVLNSLRLHLASRVLLLTGDDFVNLDAATKMLAMAPELGRRIVVLVADGQFLHAMNGTRVSAECTVFNTHQIAARHLVCHELLDHFTRTDPRDTVVLAGFGRFGQTVLAELQERAAGKFDEVILIDVDCRKQSLSFAEQVGFAAGYAHDSIEGDLRDPAVWQAIDDRVRGRSEAVFVLGSGDDRINLQAGLLLSQKYPAAFVVARGFRHSSFADELSKSERFHVFSVAELVSRSIPSVWID